MRILHTSDWHLGQTLRDFDRSYEHQCFLDWLLATIEHEKADALLVSGDIFDNANPSAASQKQLYRFLQQAKMRAPQLNVVLIAGNHDSPGRLEAPGPLLQTLGVAVVGYIARNADGEIDLERLVLPLTGQDGAIAAWCLAIPFLRPGDLPRISSTEAQDRDPYADGIAALYQQTLQLALGKRQPGQAILALGHCHMVGGTVSADSERRIVIGGTETVSASMFGPAIAYAALGHLHLAQSVGKQPHLRYCGSPLPLSFSEIGYTHQILRIDLDGETVQEITPIPVPRAVELLRIPRKPAPLSDVLAALAQLDLPLVPEQRRPYLEVRVQLDAPEPGLRTRIEAALGDKPVRLARIETSIARGTEHSSLPSGELEQQQPTDIFKQLYQHKYHSDAPADQMSAFEELLILSENDVS
jgi:DNA repair protein SbcD/Mre11